jgi:hypothetical protein
MSANDEYYRYLGWIMRGDVYYMSFSQERLRCPDTSITDSFESTQAKDIFSSSKIHHDNVWIIPR